MSDDSNNLPVPAVPDNLADVQGQIADYTEQMKDTHAWFHDKKGQAHHLALLEQEDRLKAGGSQDQALVPSDGEPTADDLVQVEGFATPSLAEVAAHFGTGPDADAKATEAINQAQMILEATPEADRGILDSSGASLADATRMAIITELSRPAPARAEHASEAVLQRLEKHGCGDLLREWGRGAARRVGIANERVNNIIDACATDEDADVFVHWFNNLTGGEMMAILRTAA